MSPSKKVYIVHTSLVSYQELNDLFAELVPEAEIFNVVDDSLLHDVKANGGIQDQVISRVSHYFKAAEESGADLIFNQCSSVGEACDIAAGLVDVPVVKVDEAMAEKAVELGSRIGVVATVASTMRPSCDLVRAKALAAGKTVEVVEYLEAGALDVLMKDKDQAKHNALVLAKIREAEAECDVIVLAQGSMTVLLPELGGISTPVLTSPRMGVERARKLLMGG